MNLAFVDKLASQNNGVKFLLVAVYSFSRFVRNQTLENYAKDTLQAFRKMISRQNAPEKFRVDKGTDYGGNLKILARRKTLKFTQH